MHADLFAFDLDDTLAHSKQELSASMAAALAALLSHRDVLIISGARFAQFESQVLRVLPADVQLERLHLMPTCGTRYLRWREEQWIEVYAHDLPEASKAEVIMSIEEVARGLGFWDTEQVWGDRIEDRGSQITYSALGQFAPIEAKREWDPTGARRETLRGELAQRLLGLEVRAGGLTSIDITERGIDKAYGVRRLLDILELKPTHMHFVGDRLQPGGNDFPVVALGVSTHEVADADETLPYLLDIVQRLS